MSAGRAETRSTGHAGRTVLATLAVDVILVVAAAFSAGTPDPGTAVGFLVSPRPSHAEAIAAVEVVVWVLLAAVVMMDLVFSMGSAGTVASRVRGRRLHARLVLASGLLLLAGGLLHQQVEAPDLCCGSLPQAESLLR